MEKVITCERNSCHDRVVFKRFHNFSLVLSSKRTHGGVGSERVEKRKERHQNGLSFFDFEFFNKWHHSLVQSYF
jgi:hypothetical protein